MEELEEIELAEPVTTVGGFVPVLKLKVAVTLTFAFMVTWQVAPDPEHPPDQPLKMELAFGEAVKVTKVPAEKRGPPGLEETLPLPVPALVTARV